MRTSVFSRRAMRWPRRRKTALPTLSAATTCASFTKALKEEWAGLESDMRKQMNRAALLFYPEPDPWDEAVRWIERQHELREEWPFPW